MPKVFERGHVAPLREQRAIAGRHVLDELRHLQGKVELSGDFGVALLQFKRGVAGAGSSGAARYGSWWGQRRRRSRTARSRCPLPIPTTSKQIRIFLFMNLLSFSRLLQIGRHVVVVVVGQREIARKIDFHAMPFADRDGGHDVQELVEDLRRRLRRALRESLAHEVGTRRVE